MARPSAPRQTGEASPAFGKGLVAAMETLVASENDLTELDRLSGDGDLGSNLARGATSVLSRQTEFTTLDSVSALRELSALVGKSVGGTSGVLYAAGLLRAANALAAQGDRGGAAWAAALLAGAEGIAEIGEAQPGDRTMLDALLPAARRLQAAIAEGKTGGLALAEAVSAAQDGAAATAAMVSRRGRSSYLGDRVVGHADGGASAVALWLKAISDALG
jgi:dihydroxyacetone kinase